MNRETLENFLKTFPDGAISWEQATDELPTMYHFLKGSGYETDSTHVVRTFETPAAWNIGWKALILTEFDTKCAESKRAFFAYFQLWFPNYSEPTPLQLLGRLRNEISMYKGHGNPGCPDRASAYLTIFEVDQLLKQNGITVHDSTV